MANNQKKATNRRVSAVGDFKQRLGGTIELPSGFVVKVRNPGGLRVFMESGTIPNSLMSIVQESLDKGKKLTEQDLMNDGELDPQMIKDMMELNDQVAMKVLVEPKVHPIPEKEEDRNEDLLYVDELPEEDKLFLFQWVTGGTRNLERFRNEHQAGVDASATGAGD